MKKCAWLLTALFLLAGCTREEPAPIWTPSPASPTPSAAVSPEPESAWWEGLVEEDLPTGLASPDQLGALGEEEVLLLGRTAVTSLYVLGGDSCGMGASPTLASRSRQRTHYPFPSSTNGITTATAWTSWRCAT